MFNSGEVAESDSTAAKAGGQDAVLTLTIQPTVGESFDLQVGLPV